MNRELITKDDIMYEVIKTVNAHICASSTCLQIKNVFSRCNTRSQLLS